MKRINNKLKKLSLATPVYAQWATGSDNDTRDVLTIQSVENIFKIFLNNIIRIAGIAVFVMLLIGGFKYLTSGGDPKKTEEARKILTFAILGLALMLSVWFILNFIKIFTGIDVTQFIFPSGN